MRLSLRVLSRLTLDCWVEPDNDLNYLHLNPIAQGKGKEAFLYPFWPPCYNELGLVGIVFERHRREPMFGKNDHKVTIYTSPNCSVCRKAKEYLAQKGIPFEEIDVASDRRAADEMVQQSGQMGVPVIIAYGVMLVGFNPFRLDVALKTRK